MSQHELKTSTFTTTDGVRLHYVDQGEGPVFLMVPAWLLQELRWDPDRDDVLS